MMWALDIAAVSQAAITVKGQLFKKDGGGGEKDGYLMQNDLHIN